MKKAIIVIVIVVALVALGVFITMQNRAPEMLQSTSPAATIDDYAQESGSASADAPAIDGDSETDTSATLLNETERIEIGGEVDQEFSGIDSDMENL